MTDLSSRLGLPAEFNEWQGTIKYPDSISFEPWRKTLMNGVLWRSLEIAQSYKGEDILSFLLKYGEPNATFYSGQRGICENSGMQQLLKEHNLRLDTTILPPGLIGREFLRTMGHGHIGFPEIYQVISGNCAFLTFQVEKENGCAKKIARPRVVFAKQSDAVILSAQEFHISVNIGNTHLLLANIVSLKTPPLTDFSLISEYHGGPYYLVRGSVGEIVFERNPSYGKYEVPELERTSPSPQVNKQLQLKKEEPIFKLIPGRIGLLDFLNAT